MHDIPQENCLGRRRRTRSRRAAFMTAGILAVGIAVAACGSGPSTPSAARSSATTTAASSSGGGGTQGNGLLAYSSCVRSHGVPNFPDPASSGGIPKVTPQQLGVSQSQLDAAQSTCQHLIPAGESLGGQNTQTITAQQQQDYLNAAACMRSHGITDFPEPIFQNGHVAFPMLDHLAEPIDSRQFKQAYQACQKDIPPGLPYSGGAGG